MCDPLGALKVGQLLDSPGDRRFLNRVRSNALYELGVTCNKGDGFDLDSP
ncbi:hypothetical protein [Diaminobutyricibacter sp. McL0608]